MIKYMLLNKDRFDHSFIGKKFKFTNHKCDIYNFANGDVWEKIDQLIGNGDQFLGASWSTTWTILGVYRDDKKVLFTFLPSEGRQISSPPIELYADASGVSIVGGVIKPLLNHIYQQFKAFTTRKVVGAL